MAESLLYYPKDWLHGTLEPASTSQLIRQVSSGSTPSTQRDDYWDGDIPWITPKDVTAMTDGLFVSQTERQITSEGLASCSAKLLPPGTVMLTKRAPVGSVVVNAVPMATNQGFLNFHCGPALRPLYLAYWFRANKDYLDLVANGSTYPELYRGDLFEFEIAVPSLCLQDRVIKVLSALQYVALLGLPLEQSVTSPEEMLALQNQTRRLAAIRNQILPLLLTGQLDVSKISTSFLGGVNVVDRFPDICGVQGCRRISGHTGEHDPHPTEAWGFFGTKDQNKLSKAGFATPRGGGKRRLSEPRCAK